MQINTSRFSLLQSVWTLNIFLALIYVSTFFGGIGHMKSSLLEYSDVQSDPFNGTTLPIAYVPNWLISANDDHALQFGNVGIDQFINLPSYNTGLLLISDSANKQASLSRFTFTTVYMGSYRMNYIEYDGSHMGVDIRAPLGTPIHAIANGVVVHSAFNNASGNFVTLRHDNVPVDGTTETLYSSYLHMNATAVTEGSKVQKGDIIGYVGSTGISTAPHVEFQIDNAQAPYHPYWPYTTAQATAAGLDFFGAINAWLGKENAIKYSIDPMPFVYANQNFNDSANVMVASSISVSIDGKITSGNNLSNATNGNGIVEQVAGNKTVITLADSGSAATTANTATNSSASTTTNSGTSVTVAPSASATVVTAPSNSTNDSATSASLDSIISNITTDNAGTYNDIPSGSAYYAASQYFMGKNIFPADGNGNFNPDSTMNRSDALIAIFKIFWIDTKTSNTTTFKDVFWNDPIRPYIDKAIEVWIISKNSYFRPFDAVTRAELTKMLVVASGLKILTPTANVFADVPQDSGIAPYVLTLVRTLGINQNGNFSPQTPLNKGATANLLYAVKIKTSN